MNKLNRFVLFILITTVISTVQAEPFREGVVAYQQQQYQQALEAWLPLAESGHVLAQTLVGSMYAYGEGVAKNDDEAFKWLSLAANTGSAQAQFNLAILYENGFGTAKNLELAQKWFKAAADQGRKDAAQRYDTLVSNNIDSPTPDMGINDVSTEDKVTQPTRIHLVLTSNDSALLGPPDTENRGLSWFNQQPPDNYTIQLAASIEPRLIEAFKKQIKLKSNYADTTSTHIGREWHALIYGSYPTVREAKLVIAEFPEDWKAWQPWIKRFSTVKHIKN